MNNQESTLEVKSFIQLLLSRKKIFLTLILITAVISIIISYIIPPKYKTTAVVYPIHLAPYSEESPTEQLLQYFNSIQVRDIVIKKMNLIQHYRIDTSQKEWKSILHSLYRENISFSPTLYESIEIEVKDKQPEKTKQIAECIIQTTDSMILGFKRKIVYEEYSNYQREIDKIQKRIDSLNQLLVNIQNQYNILDANYQARYLSKKLSQGKLDAESQKLVENLKNKKEFVQILQKKMNKQIVSLGKLILEINRLEVDLNGELHFMQVISPPYVPDKKYFPVRWLIVALSELAVISIFIIYLLFSQPIKK